jgi:hypothetical protein
MLPQVDFIWVSYQQLSQENEPMLEFSDLGSQSEVPLVMVLNNELEKPLPDQLLKGLVQVGRRIIILRMTEVQCSLNVLITQLGIEHTQALTTGCGAVAIFTLEFFAPGVVSDLLEINATPWRNPGAIQHT